MRRGHKLACLCQDTHLLPYSLCRNISDSTNLLPWIVCTWESIGCLQVTFFFHFCYCCTCKESTQMKAFQLIGLLWLICDFCWKILAGCRCKFFWRPTKYQSTNLLWPQHHTRKRWKFVCGRPWRLKSRVLFNSTIITTFGGKLPHPLQGISSANTFWSGYWSTKIINL